MKIWNGAQSGLLGAAGLAAVLGLALIGCSEGSDDGSTPGEMLDKTMGSVEAGVNEAADRMGAGADRLVEGSQEMAEGARQMASDSAQYAGETVDSARESAQYAGEAVTGSIDSAGRELDEAQRELTRPYTTK